MNAFVTGAGGFIGTVLTRELVRQGHQVRALALPGENTDALHALGVEVRIGDLLDRQSIKGACEGSDTVFHLAGRVTDWGTRKQFYSAIYDATARLLDEAAGAGRRFVYASSIAAIGLGRHMKGFRETDPARKSGTPYNDAKLDTEHLVLARHRAGDVSATIIRPANVTGPGSVWVKDIVEKMLAMPVPLIDGGRHSSSFIYVDSLVDGIILASLADVARGKIYQLRDDWDATWKQYTTDLGSFVGKKPMGSLPYLPARMLGAFFDLVCTPLGVRPPISRMSVDILGRNNDVDNTRAKTELGWKTKVPYPEAMDSIGAWVRATYDKG
jgi:2-alkyl-3-oxoalkanoate reductase